MRTCHFPRCAATATAFLLSLPALTCACPLCDTQTGRQVREGIFGDDFWSTLLVVTSPFPVLLLTLAAYQYDWLRLGKNKANASPSESSQAPPKPSV